MRTRLADVAVFLAISVIPPDPLPGRATARDTNVDRGAAINFYQECDFQGGFRDEE
jgi:hypothetical protein